MYGKPALLTHCSRGYDSFVLYSLISSKLSVGGTPPHEFILSQQYYLSCFSLLLRLLIRSWHYLTQLSKQAQRTQYLEGAALKNGITTPAETALTRIISNFRLKEERS